MLPEYFALNIEQQLSKITEHGFCVMDNFISSSTALALSNEINVLHDGANMHGAGTGQERRRSGPWRGSRAPRTPPSSCPGAPSTCGESP